MKGIGNRSSEIFVYALVRNLGFSSFLGFSFGSSDFWLLFITRSSYATTHSKSILAFVMACGGRADDRERGGGRDRIC